MMHYNHFYNPIISYSKWLYIYIYIYLSQSNEFRVLGGNITLVKYKCPSFSCSSSESCVKLEYSISVIFCQTNTYNTTFCVLFLHRFNDFFFTLLKQWPLTVTYKQLLEWMNYTCLNFRNFIISLKAPNDHLDGAL